MALSLPTPPISLAAISDFLDHMLRTAEIPDYDRALNGVQFENRQPITKVAAAVDFSLAAVQGAAAAGAQLLLVHHGMFWGGLGPITEHRFAQVAALLEYDIAVYSSHLPLDLHSDFGNNVLLARELGLLPDGGFARFQQVEVGLSGRSDIATGALVERARRFATARGGHVVTTEIQPGQMTRRWGICTGAGADTATLREAANRRLDTLIVGEGPHHTAVEARERSITLMYLGHYATETLGVSAIAREVARAFALAWTFLDFPTGL